MKQLRMLCVFLVFASLCLLLVIIPSANALDEADIGQPDPVESDQIDTDTLMSMSIEDLMQVKIVSASKKSESVSEAPASVFVITRDDIEQHGYRTMGEALRQVVGLYTFTDGTFNYVGVRGYARPDDWDTRVLFLVDGHRVNSVIYDSAFVGEAFPVDIDNIDRIEVVKGPGSALWGTNALLAIINVITISGAEENGTRVKADYGSFARTKGFIEYSHTSPDGFRVDGSYSNMVSGGRPQIYYEEYDDPSTNNGIAQDLDCESAQHAHLRAEYRGFTFLLDTVNRYKLVPSAKYFTEFNAHEPPSDEIDQQSFAELNFTREISKANNSQVFCRVYRDNHTMTAHNSVDWGAPTLVVNKNFGESRSWGAEVRYSQELSDRLSAIFGAGYEKFYHVYQTNYNMPPYLYLRYSIDVPYDMRSYYVQTDYSINEALKLVTGLRLDNYSTVGSICSPRWAFVYSPSEPTTLKLLYGRAFRAPNEFERNIDVEHYYEPNRDLTPEYIKTLELVWEQRIGRGSRLVTSIFRFDMEDIITQTVLGNGELQFQNLGQVRSEGVEMQLETKSEGGQTGHVGVSLLNAQDMTTSEQITNSPSFTAFGSFSIPVGSRGDNRMFITPEVRHISRLRMINGDYIPASTVGNLIFYSENEKSGLDITLGVYNIFDTITYTPAAYSFTQDKLPQEGRTITLQISKRS